MSDMKIPGDFFKEGALVSDTSWLDVDPWAYREHERLPHQNLDTIPDLEEQWRRRPQSMDIPVNFLDNDQMRRDAWGRDVPFWEKKTRMDLTDEQRRILVGRFLTKSLMTGVTGQDLATALNRTFDPDTIRLSSDIIKMAVAERGLLGRVYIRAADFDRCAQPGDSSHTFVKAHAKTAKFVVQKEACADCTLAREGQCGAFQKKLVAEVPYDQSLADEYAQELAEQGKVVPKQATDVREALKAAFLSAPVQIEQVQQARTVQVVPEVKIAFEDAWEQLVPETKLAGIAPNDHTSFKAAQRLMMAGKGRPRVASDSLNEALDAERHLLGQLYVTLTPFKNLKEAATFILANEPAKSAPFVIVPTEVPGFAEHVGKVLNKTPVARVEDALNTSEALQMIVARLRALGVEDPERKVAEVHPKRRAGLFRAAFDRQIDRAAPVHDTYKHRSPEASDLEAQAAMHQAGGKVAASKEEGAAVAVTAKVRPILRTLTREMLSGKVGSELDSALEQKFTGAFLNDPDVEKTLHTVRSQEGLFGKFYTLATAFDDCQEGSKFLRRSASSVNQVVMGPKCADCIHNKPSHLTASRHLCAVYQKMLVEKPWYLEVTAAKAIENQVKKAKLSEEDVEQIYSLPSLKERIKAAYLAKRTDGPAQAQHTAQVFTGSPQRQVFSSDRIAQVVQYTREKLNEGWYGKNLRDLIATTFSADLIHASQEALGEHLAEEGLQGIIYVDASVHASPTGTSGCDKGALVHRGRGVRYLKAMERCGSCVLAQQGVCQKYNKEIVVEVPYDGPREEIQAQILASDHQVADPASLFAPSGTSVIAEFDLGKVSLLDGFELNAAAPDLNTDLDIFSGVGPSEPHPLVKEQK